MKNLKDTLVNVGLFALALIGCFAFPVGVYFASQQDHQATDALAVQTEQPVTAAMPPELMLILKQIADKSAPKTHTVRQIQPTPDPMIAAINRMERNYQQLVKQIADRDEKMSEQLTQFLQSHIRSGEVDRSGNTKEQLEDIYQDANVPQLPDAMVKGLAANPGARAMIHPDHGQPVIATTEWGVTNYGGGKQLTLIRHNGRMYGQTVIHGDQSISKKTEPPQQQEKQPAFNLNLGNN